MRIAVVGSGAIGGYYGGRLQETGHGVVFVARGAHLDALRRRGLTVRTPAGESTVPVTAVAETGGMAPVDLVLFCVKSYHTDIAARLLPALMAPHTAVLTLQNGVDNADAIGARWSAPRRWCRAWCTWRSSSPGPAWWSAPAARARSSSASATAR